MTSSEYKQARLRLGLTQKKLAARVGMTQPMVARIESGRQQPTNQQAAAIKLLLEMEGI